MDEPERLTWVGSQTPPPAPPPVDKVRELAQDRLSAALHTGGRTTLGVGALTLLYELASDPTQNVNALRMLHELQVHQVEIELQHEELQRVREEAGTETTRALTWFDVAPTPLVALGLDGRVLHANRQAAKLFSLLPASVVGQPLARFLASADAPRLRALLLRVANGQGVLSEVFTVVPAGTTGRAVEIPSPELVRYTLRAAHAHGTVPSIVLTFEATA